MKTMPCPACNKQVSLQAEACPQCGHPITDKDRNAAVQNGKAGKIGCMLIILLVAGYFFFTSPSEPDTPQAMAYTVLAADNGIIGPTGTYIMTEVSIQANPNTYPVTGSMLADTAVNAAWDFYKKTKGDSIRVWVVIDSAHVGQGDVLAQADYRSKKKNVDGSEAPEWTVKALGRDITKQQWEAFPSSGLGAFTFDRQSYDVK